MFGPRHNIDRPSPELSALPMNSQSYFLEITQMTLASLCSLILWQYAAKVNAPSNFGHVCVAPVDRSNFVADTPKQVKDCNVIGHILALVPPPAPKLVLLSALGFGCCVSSFVYRRQGEDPSQIIVIALVAGTVTTMAWGAKACPDRMVLGYMPLATCAAMITSMVGHAMFRWVRSQQGTRVETQEKLQLV